MITIAIPLIWYTIGFFSLVIAVKYKHGHVTVDDLINAFFWGFLGLYTTYACVDDLCECGKLDKIKSILNRKVF